MIRPRDEAGVTPDMRDPETPDKVVISATAPPPFTDPTLGIPVRPRTFAPALPRNRLVAIGDSLTHGFMSGAIHRTDLSAPAIVAHELGLGTSFRQPVYGGPGDGLPFNIEALLRHLERGSGASVRPWQIPGAALRVRSWMDDVEDYWERGDGSRLTPAGRINHNLGVYGWGLGQALDRSAGRLRREIEADRTRDHLLAQLVEHHGARAGYRALAADGALDLTAFGLARALGREVGGGGDPAFGIETLLVMLGSNHALETVVALDVNWRGGPREYDDRPVTVWNPPLFKKLLDGVVAQVKTIAARRVIWGMVPHVTIAPIARGVEETKVADGSRYFPYYTRPWISDRDFDPDRDRKITHQQARAVDSAIDHYNDDIAEAVIAARRAGLEWYVIDLAGILDRLAQRRYIKDRLAQPSWWSAYALPPELASLDPPPDSRFFSTGASGRRDAGGLFSLDGVHPTTIGYGLLAQEVIGVMSAVGVVFHDRDGNPRTPPVRVDFARLLSSDTLNSDPPRSLDSTLRTIGWLDEHVPFLSIGP